MSGCSTGVLLLQLVFSGMDTAGATDGKNNLCKLTTDLQISVNDV